MSGGVVFVSSTSGNESPRHSDETRKGRKQIAILLGQPAAVLPGWASDGNALREVYEFGNIDATVYPKD